MQAERGTLLVPAKREQSVGRPIIGITIEVHRVHGSAQFYDLVTSSLHLFHGKEDVGRRPWIAGMDAGGGTSDIELVPGLRPVGARFDPPSEERGIESRRFLGVPRPEFDE